MRLLSIFEVVFRNAHTVIPCFVNFDGEWIIQHSAN